MRFTGRFNAYNLTAVFGASVSLGWPVEKVLVAMSRLIPVAGRFQAFHSPKGCTAIVDYAHTPDAVVNVLTAIREVVGTNGRIITVVGAGGNRDKGKRPIMAREAARLSDLLILTSDNPRFENPAEILRDMEAGLDTDELRANASTWSTAARPLSRLRKSPEKGTSSSSPGKAMRTTRKSVASSITSTMPRLCARCSPPAPNDLTPPASPTSQHACL